MKTYISALVLAMVVFFGACSKDDSSSKSCEAKNTGTITFTNSHEDRYDVYVNGGVVFTLGAYNTQKRNDINAGNVSLKFIQKDGYIFYATEISYNVSLNTCEDKFVSF